MISGTNAAAKPQHLYLNTTAQPGDISYADVLSYHVDAVRAHTTNTKAHEAVNALIATLFGVSADDALYFHTPTARGRYDNIKVNRWHINLDTLCHDLANFRSLAVEARLECQAADAAYWRFAHLEELAAEGVAPCLDDTLKALGYESIEEACRTAAREVSDIQQDLRIMERCIQDAEEWMEIFNELDISLRSTAIALGFADALDTRDQPRVATIYTLPLSDGREVVAPLEVQAVLQDIFALAFGIGTPELVVRRYIDVCEMTLNSEDFTQYARTYVPAHPIRLCGGAPVQGGLR